MHKGAGNGDAPRHRGEKTKWRMARGRPDKSPCDELNSQLTYDRCPQHLLN